MKGRRLLKFGAAGTIFLLASASITGAARPLRETTVTGHPCRLLPVKDTYSVDASGRRVAHADDSTAKVKVFGSGDSAMSVTVPPKSFDPHTASQEQLHRYGFPPRPKSGAALARWNKLYPHRSIQYVTPTMCSANNGVRHLPRTPRHTAKPAVTSDTSTNWSGGIAIQQPQWSSFTFAVVQWVEPNFIAGCSSASGYSIWSGLGGWNAASRRTKYGLSGL